MKIICVGLTQSGEPFKYREVFLAGARRGCQRFKAQEGFDALLFA